MLTLGILTVSVEDQWPNYISHSPHHIFSELILSFLDSASYQGKHPWSSSALSYAAWGCRHSRCAFGLEAHEQLMTPFEKFLPLEVQAHL